MAPTGLVIAKASLLAALLKPDPTSCSKSDIDQLHQLLTDAINRCSPGNVQKCKQWALRYLVQSAGRITAFGKFLVALSSSYAADDVAKAPDVPPPTKRARVPSVKRRRLHMLYLVSDILFHTKVRNRDATFAAGIEATLPDLVRNAAAFPNTPKHANKINDLLAIWTEAKYFSISLTSQLRTIVEDAAAAAAGRSDEAPNGAAPSADGPGSGPALKTKEVPYIVPLLHGDPAAPWYDLPAASWLRVIEPNSTRPMNPSMIKPLQLSHGPADKPVVEAVKHLLADVERMYAKDARVDHDRAAAVSIDQLGERIELDEINGDILDGDTYYGWSRAFCKKMRTRRNNNSNNTDNGVSGRDRHASSSRSDSRSRSRSRTRSSRDRSSSPPPAFKRRRMSHSRSRSRSRGRDRTPSASHSRSYSRDRYRRRTSTRSRSVSRSRSRDRNRGQSPRGRGQHDDAYDRRRSQSRSSSQSRSRSPPYRIPHGGPPVHNNGIIIPGRFNQPLPNHPPQQQQQQQQPAVFIPMHPQQPPFTGFHPHPVPPPPPPNYQGQWPPPPPPPPPLQQGWAPPGPPPHSGWSGGWANPPPPIPPNSPPLPQQQPPNMYPGQGRGGNQNYRGGWNGGYGRGRGW